MIYIILPNLRLVPFFIYSIIKSFKIVFMHHLAINSIVIYHTTIILNILNKVADYIELRIVKLVNIAGS